jgi:hypothetical protein
MTEPETEEATAFEDEDTGAEDAPLKPWDPALIRVMTKTFALRQVVDEIGDGTIDLAPDFQRDYVWKERQKTRLIESILLGIPLPAFYFDATKDNTYQVVDGVQRLTTVRDFAAGAFALSNDLEYIKEIAGKNFQTLESPLRRRFHQTQIVVHVIESTSPRELKYDIFRRINTGGTPLTPQEIRHCMSRSRSRDLLRNLASSETFVKVTELGDAHKKRMEDRELVLRFIAFYRLWQEDPTFQAYSKYETLDAFLLSTAAAVDDPDRVPKDEYDSYGGLLDRAMRNATLVFGRYAFRKWGYGTSRRGLFNRALFESWSVALASAPELSPAQADAVRDAARVKMSEERYERSIRQGTGKIEQVRYRMPEAIRIVKAATDS